MDTPTPPQNKRWEVVLGSIIILIIIATAAYFVLVKNNITSPNTQPLPLATKTPSPGANPLQIKNFSLTDVKNASFYPPTSLGQENLYIFSDNPDNHIYLKDGIATFSYCDKPYESCNSDKAEKGTITLSNITTLQNSETLPNITDWGGSDGAMILIFDFNGKTEYYFTTFSLYYFENKNSLSLTPLKKLGTVGANVEGIKVNSKGEIVIDFKSPSGISSKTYEIYAGRRFYDLIEITQDGMGKIYDDQKLGYTFIYPKSVNISGYGLSLRATVVEKDQKISPIYYAQECGLQPSFADNTIPFWSNATSPDGQSSVNLSAEFTAHKITDQTLYLTSSLYGYDPADWGKIKQKVSIQGYLNDVRVGTPIVGRKVVLENMGGVPVRHIMPFSIGRPCDDQNREQYQWVRGDLFFNLIFTDSKTQPASIEQKTALINSIFSSLKLK